MEGMELLRKLCETPGVSGYEEPIQKFVADELRAVMTKVKVDRLGNVIGYRKADERSKTTRTLKVMIAAHIDEIGFLVRFIDKNGFLRLDALGGFDPRTLISQRVVIHGKKDIIGVIAPYPIWLLTQEARKKAPELKDLFVDLGMPRDKVTQFIRVGDAVSLAQDFRELNDEVVTGRNFDDRIGVYAMLEALRKIETCYADIYAVGTIQEELGVRGAGVAAFQTEPDIGIAIDGSLASDIPDVREEDKHCSLGNGTGIYLVDRLTVSSRRLVDYLIKLAKEHNIPYQLNIGGGTDASAIQRTRTGALACTIGAPTRYMHSTVQLCHKGDIEATVNLLKVFLERVHEAEF